MSTARILPALRRLGPWLAPHRRRVGWGLVAIAIGVVFGAFVPLLVGDAVDAFAASPSRATMLRYAALVIAATLLRGVFSYIQRMVLVTVSRDVEASMRRALFRHLERQPAAFFAVRSIGDLMARATSDLGAVRMLCGPAIMYAANTLLSAVLAIGFLLSIHPRLTLVALAPAPFVALATRFIGQRIHRHHDAAQGRWAELTGRVQENLAGARVVRALAREEQERAAFAAIDDHYVASARTLVSWNAVFEPLLGLLVGGGFVAVLWLGGGFVRAGSLTVGELVAFSFFLSRLVWPMIAIGWVTNLAERGAASLARIEEVLEVAPGIVEGGIEAPIEDGEIELRSLSFAHAGDRGFALDSVTARIEAGETVAIVGPTGAGKSTVLALLARILDPPAGSVLIDGVDVRERTFASLRGGLALVPQEPLLFSATIAENIAFGVPEASREAIDAAARRAGLAADLEGFPRGLDTVVGERGVTLSGGQRQRVAIARALLRDPRLLLLDDPLSAVDAETESAILASLREVVEGRTVIVVTHRTTTARLADRVLVLDRGRLVESGRHAELVAAGGLYAELDRRQRLERELTTA